ncbi:MAG: hypothetical protein JNK67_20305 [Alphaproteobacteria bacterium]|nr:hypothetical protein [Alphaproteobacteria bacterium]
MTIASIATFAARIPGRARWLSQFAALPLVAALGAAPTPAAAQTAAPTTAPAAAATAPAAAPAASANFDVVRKYLDIGGPLFVFMDVDGEAARIGRELTAAVAKAIGDDPDMAIFKQDYAGVMADLGLAQVKSVGMSSVARPGGGFHNRAFIYVPERRGLFSILGGPAKPFTTSRLAPADTDLFIETEIDMPALVTAVSTIAARFIQGAGPEMANDLIGAVGGEDAATGFQIVTSMKGRISFILRLGETTVPDPKRIEEWGFGFAQKAQLLLRAEGIGQKLIPLLAKVNELTSETVGSLRIYRAKESVPFLGDNQPVLAIDGETVLVATSQAFLQQSLARSGGSLAESAAYRATLAAVGQEEGNSLLYGTPRMFTLVRALLLAAGEAAPKGTGDEFLGPLLQVLVGQIPDLSEPLAQVTANVPDGIVMRGNNVASLRSALLTLGIYNPDLIGPILLAAVPAAVQMQVQQKAQGKAAENTEANLQAIAEVALEFFRDNPDAGEVTYKDVEAKLAGRLKPVKDMDFTDFTLERSFNKLEVELPNGQTVTYHVPLTDADREAIRKNLALFDRVVVWYFQKNPGETVMLGNEATDPGSPMRELPASVRGENYNELQVRKTDTEIALDINGETISVRRDPALQRPAPAPQRTQPQRPQQQRPRQGQGQGG